MTLTPDILLHFYHILFMTHLHIVLFIPIIAVCTFNYYYI